jgi:riboflavin synthase
MFTGIISELGEVESVETGDDGARIRIKATLASELAEGDSVAINGACLTATSAGGGAFEADVMRQTLGLTTLGELAPSAAVNLELPLRPSDRMGGHIVQGHVDGTATVAGSQEDGFARRLRLQLPDELLDYVVEHGSIAIEGVSLTIAGLGDDWIEVSLISETLERTNLGALKPGDRVNVECDLMARYLRRMLPALSPLSPEGAPQAKLRSNPINEGSS